MNHKSRFFSIFFYFSAFVTYMGEKKPYSAINKK
jgi:hypothetical protein